VIDTPAERAARARAWLAPVDDILRETEGSHDPFDLIARTEALHAAGRYLEAADTYRRARGLEARDPAVGDGELLFLEARAGRIARPEAIAALNSMAGASLDGEAQLRVYAWTLWMDTTKGSFARRKAILNGLLPSIEAAVASDPMNLDLRTDQLYCQAELGFWAAARETLTTLDRYGHLRSVSSLRTEMWVRLRGGEPEKAKVPYVASCDLQGRRPRSWLLPLFPPFRRNLLGLAALGFMAMGQRLMFAPLFWAGYAVLGLWSLVMWEAFNRNVKRSWWLAIPLLALGLVAVDLS
jgi:hypothetical protein